MRKIMVKGNQVVLSLVCLVLGFMIAFSYHLTQEENKTKQPRMTDRQYDKTISLRNQLIAQEVSNRKLQKELKQKQEEVVTIEKKLSQETKEFSSLAEEAESYRMFLGKVKVKGSGVKVTLDDGAYDPKDQNANNYLVHEFHVFKVINELYIAGAATIAINGQRLTNHSYINCNGPVITVDGIEHPAPFVIQAIGDAEVMSAALNINGGIKDQLVNDNIIFTLEKQDEMILNPILGN